MTEAVDQFSHDGSHRSDLLNDSLSSSAIKAHKSESSHIQKLEQSN